MVETEVIAPSFGLWIGIALGFALWAAGIAGAKQRSRLLFGALGFMFGLLGVLIACYVAPPRSRKGPTYAAFEYAKPRITPASSR